MSQFAQSEDLLDQGLKTIDCETGKAPEERLTDPEAARGVHRKFCRDDEHGSYNRSIVQGLMDCVPPHDDAELENKGQIDRFNITTGEGPAIKNEAVSAYMDIYTTPKVLAEIPLSKEFDETLREGWSQIMAEEYTAMERGDDASLPLHLQLADTYVTHGVAIAFFDDKQTMRYSVSGLDHFKFPRKSGVISSQIEICTAEGTMSVTDLYDKIGLDGWDDEMIKATITQTGSRSNQQRWNNWEAIQRDIKANEVYMSSVCDPVRLIYCWVKEFSGKISFYITPEFGIEMKDGDKERFLFKERDFYDSPDQAFQIFPFSIGNGGRLYTVRGLGYLIYQICNAMDILHCKMMDNAKIGSSLLFQTATSEDQQDIQLTDFGGGIAIPPNVKVVEKQLGQNLNNSLVPALEASRSILDRATGGIASGNMIMNPENDRRTKLEVSSQLEYLNKLNSFAVNLFHGPYDKITREKVRRAFTVRQKDTASAKRVKEMKKRCMERGVPEEAFEKIDFKQVKATRIIGTGSRTSRIMLYDQMKEYYSTWDAVGRSNFDYDVLSELIGAEKAERYAGRPNEKRQPYDYKFAQLENFQLLEGDYMDPIDSDNHMVHLPVHIEELEAGLQGVDEGQIDLKEWTMEHIQLYKHAVAHMDMATVHETMEPELNEYRQRLQQIGEIATNGMKALNKDAKEAEEKQAQQGAPPDPETEMKLQGEAQKQAQAQAAATQKLQQDMQMHLQKLNMNKQLGEQNMVLKAQEAMLKSGITAAEAQARIARIKASQG